MATHRLYTIILFEQNYQRRQESGKQTQRGGEKEIE